MNTPIYNTIREYIDAGVLPFHMPGHKMGKGLPAEFADRLAAFDLTEIPGTDYLHQPLGVIREAQELAADAFGARETYFLVNGSTCGIYSMVHTICKPGDRLVVSRDCHQSVVQGMLLAGVKPVYIMPEYEQEFFISSGIKPEKLEQTLDENLDVAGVLITRPSYYGICSDIERLVAIAHSYGKIFAVDEAHGAHLKFGNKLPVCAMDAGADICVQSAHKTLNALTQGAYLHVKSERIDIDRLKYYMEIFQTSSPSYLIMASLDIARETMANQGGELLDNLVDWIQHNKLQYEGRQIRFLEESGNNKFDLDNTRICANVQGLGITGYQAEMELRNAFNIQIEMADLYNIICIATIADTEETIRHLFDSLVKLERKIGLDVSNKVNRHIAPLNFNLQSNRGFTIHDKSEWVKLGSAVGRTSKAIIVPYPPGIPIICPGEIISKACIDYLTDILDSGCRINGINENLEINVI